MKKIKLSEEQLTKLVKQVIEQNIDDKEVLMALGDANMIDDSDIEIEGMRIGDSLLKIMSKDEIELQMEQMYKSKKFSTVIYHKTEIYDLIQFSFFTDDDSFIIKDIEAKLIFKYDIKSCLKKLPDIF